MPLKQLSMLVRSKKPKVQITIPAKKDFYTTNDRIEGLTTILACTDTFFTSVMVHFTGNSQTYVDRSIAVAGDRRSGGTHQFLKLRQPGVARHLPEDGILRAGQQYTVPFEFVIPSQLLPQCCKHAKDSTYIGDAHLQLPPSLSDGDGRADIQYGVIVQIMGQQDGDIIVSRFHTIWLAPTSAYVPIVDQTTSADEYTTIMGKNLRCLALAKNNGTIVASSTESNHLCMTASDYAAYTTIPISLRYEKNKQQNIQPPVVDSVSTVLHGTTYYASSGRKAFPSKADWLSDPTQGIYTNSIKLGTISSPGIAWQQSKDCRTASLQLQIRLATEKILAPTFHSCLISRVYRVQIRLKIKSGGVSTTLELNVPLNITGEGTSDDKKLYDDSFDFEDSLCLYMEPAPMYRA